MNCLLDYLIYRFDLYFLSHFFYFKVRRGAALLDKKKEYWWRDVNLTTLSFLSSYVCNFDDNTEDLLAQIYKSRDRGKRELFGSVDCWDFTRTHGFRTTLMKSDALTMAWKRVIRKRIKQRDRFV